jgi:hypothetical protein
MCRRQTAPIRPVSRTHRQADNHKVVLLLLLLLLLLLVACVAKQETTGYHNISLYTAWSSD